MSMIEYNCGCAEVGPYPHTHWTKTVVRRDPDDGHTFEMSNQWIGRPGYVVVSIEHGVRFWGDRIQVNTDDLADLLRRANDDLFYESLAAREPLKRLMAELADHDERVPRPPKEDR